MLHFLLNLNWLYKMAVNPLRKTSSDEGKVPLKSAWILEQWKYQLVPRKRRRFSRQRICPMHTSSNSISIFDNRSSISIDLCIFLFPGRRRFGPTYSGKVKIETRNWNKLTGPIRMRSRFWSMFWSIHYI